jgi:AraC-like DNA-binding protein
MTFDYDITYADLNPTVFYISKVKMLADGTSHKHDFTEIAYILSGKGSYRIEDKDYPVETGDLVICNSGVRHTHVVTNPKEPTLEFIIGFTDFHFKNMAANCIELKGSNYILHTVGELKQEMNRHCFAMILENEGNKAGKYFMLKAHLIQMLLLIIREIDTIERPQQKSYNFESYSKSYAVNRIITYLNENYEHKISLEQIAHNMYLSPVYISKIFKEETGESPINYLIKIRLEKAREILLSQKYKSIKNIANQVGYDDVYHFSKLFKKYYGISPSYYKEGT